MPETLGRAPIHPDEILSEELAVVGISAAELARQPHVPASRIIRLVKGQGNLTADTALRLAKWFGTSPAFWLNLQKSYELHLAQQAIGDDLNTIRLRAKPTATRPSQSSGLR